MQLLYKIFVGWVIVATAPELCPKCESFPEKKDERVQWFSSLIVRLGRWASLSKFSRCCTSLENSVDLQLKKSSVCAYWVIYAILIHLCLMEFPTYIDWTNPF